MLIIMWLHFSLAPDKFMNFDKIVFNVFSAKSNIFHRLFLTEIMFCSNITYYGLHYSLIIVIFYNVFFSLNDLYRCSYAPKSYCFQHWLAEPWKKNQICLDCWWKQFEFSHKVPFNSFPWIMHTVRLGVVLSVISNSKSSGNIMVNYFILFINKISLPSVTACS